MTVKGVYMRKYFGTDGMRGKINDGHMTPDVILKLALATGHYFKSKVGRHLVVIGKDTRLSGYMVEPALVAGLTAAGMDTVTVGPVPTPAIAMLTKSLRADAGVMISASHNPYEDNGIKIFDPNGCKLSDEVEKEIERLMDGDLTDLYAPADRLGRAIRLDDVSIRYCEYVKNILGPDLNLSGMRIALDSAHGAAYKIAPKVFETMGATVLQIGNQPNGRNINDNVGATSPQALAQFVVENNADIGFALDGDADRLIVVDEKGNVIDGDQTIALIAKSLQDSDRLTGNVVTTVMSNMGLEKYLNDNGMQLTRTKVGDRYVGKEMRQSGSNFGGEQSGHLVLSDFSTTGDGTVAGLCVLRALIKSGLPASTVCDVFKPYPQILKNICVQDFSVLQHPDVVLAIAQGDKTLHGMGRTLIRKSGTEPLIRVMAEGTDLKTVESEVDSIIDAIKNV
jgi:phosphoglucosamine mutase